MDSPRIVIAGTHSGVGKTSVTLAVVAALRKRGFKVQTFKVGPDFLDPSYLTMASERPCYNLDGWMAGRDYVCRLFARASESADISVIEGVMGLFDGADPDSSAGSTAEIARWLDAPVLLVVDVYGIARSIAAVVKGYTDFEAGLRVAGVIANRCGSEGHALWLAESLASASLPPLAGAIPMDGFPHLPSRHLGLVTADTGNLSRPVLNGLADVFEKYASVDTVMEIARRAPSLDVKSITFPPPAGGIEGGVKTGNRFKRISIGVAYDEAFHFYYRDFFDELEMMGCMLKFFSPIADNHLPEGIDALYIGGGYPEEHAEALAANEEMHSDIRKFSSSGRPVYGECGGLMYLSRTLETKDGVQYPMVGLIPASTRMLDRIKSLAYVEVTLNADSLWGARGTTLRGHEFHYSELTADLTENEGWATAYTVRKRRADDIAREGFQSGSVLASYTHLHLASRPEALQYFMNKIS
ncbi:MAG: cobyrinate a,c-diamide synthase [Deltaproteobacteria bacterium]|nr:cobyrinate a,c-diamide synthase [Deltaproteobacteria bacterium]